MRDTRPFLLSFAILLVAWEAYFHLSGVGEFFLAPPSAIGERLLQSAASGRLFLDVGASLALLALGLGVAAGLGIPAGLCLGVWRTLEAAFGPYLVVAYATPAVVFLPLILMWFGFGLLTRVLIVASFAVLPILLNVWWGMRTLDAAWLRVARVFGASRREIIWQVLLPGSVGHILASLRIGGGLALIGVFVAELYGANAGVGYLGIVGAKRMDIAGLLTGLILLGALGVALEGALAYAERRLAPWRTAP